jgi:acetylornithine deacetylase/succinyl-diaminopimelate desuccinylase-like protein
MLFDAKTAGCKFAGEGHVLVSWERLWHIAPRPFDDELIALCDEAIRETCGKSHRMPSGPLHDAAEMAAAGVPTVMMFVQSLHGISHNKIEDTKEEHLELAVTAFDKLAEKVIKWIAEKNRFEN